MCIYTCICVYTCMFIRLYNICMYIYICSCIHTYIHMQTYVCAYVCTHNVCMQKKPTLCDIRGSRPHFVCCIEKGADVNFQGYFGFIS